MREFAEKIVDIRGNESLEELKGLLRENFDMIQRILDGLTGQRLETWTAVRRDGSIPMIGDLTIEDADIKFGNKTSTGGLNVKSKFRRTKDGTFQFSHDGVTWFDLWKTSGTSGQVLCWPTTGSTPVWISVSGLLNAVASLAISGNLTVGGNATVTGSARVGMLRIDEGVTSELNTTVTDLLEEDGSIKLWYAADCTNSVWLPINCGGTVYMFPGWSLPAEQLTTEGGLPITTEGGAPIFPEDD